MFYCNSLKNDVVHTFSEDNKVLVYYAVLMVAKMLTDMGSGVIIMTPIVIVIVIFNNYIVLYKI